MNKKRLIITSSISIILVSILLIGSTYSIFTNSNVDEDLNVYKTGVLDITYTLSSENVTLTDSTPTSLEDHYRISPYRITVTNNGSVPYMFNVSIEETTASNQISKQYIMTEVGQLPPIELSNCKNNILKKEIIIPAHASVDIDVRIWISDTVPNSEIGKSFFAKLKIDGLAIYDKNEEIDNSILIAKQVKYLSRMKPGSYVKYVGNNGCEGKSCEGQNANYTSDSNMGYCDYESNSFKVNGWRIGYVKENSVYLMSAGAPECLCTNSNGTASNSSCSNYESIDGVPTHLTNLNNAALKYCNIDYAYGGVCDNSNTWAMNEADFQTIMNNSTISLSTCNSQNQSEECGYSNDLITNGGTYWFATAYFVTPPYPSAYQMWPQQVSNWTTAYIAGIRPVIRLDPEIEVIGGTGTYEDPYIIAKGGYDVDIASDKIVKLYEDGSTINTVHIGADTSKPSVSLNATQGLMLDNNGEYRYYGANPNNYVTFNGELWRIISVSNVKSSATDTTGAMRMKIIRNDSIGKYSWDSSESTVNSGYGINEWSKADLKNELNTLYYNSQSGTCYNARNNASTTCDFTTIGLKEDAKNMITSALWHLGGKNIVANMNAIDYYTFERASVVYNCSTDDGACPRTSTWEGNIGLMYPSDYMYATDLSQCSKVGYNSAGEEADYRNTTCVENNWLYKNAHQWTLSPYIAYSYGAYRINQAGYIYAINACSNDSVRPVVYLKPNVKIVNGKGTNTEPYQLSMN